MYIQGCQERKVLRCTSCVSKKKKNLFVIGTENIVFEVVETVVMKSSFFCDIPCWLLHANFLLNLLFNSEDGGDMLLRNFCSLAAC
jgi:hypothetical protein